MNRRFLIVQEQMSPILNKQQVISKMNIPS